MPFAAALAVMLATAGEPAADDLGFFRAVVAGQAIELYVFHEGIAWRCSDGAVPQVYFSRDYERIPPLCGLRMTLAMPVVRGTDDQGRRHDFARSCGFTVPRGLFGSYTSFRLHEETGDFTGTEVILLRAKAGPVAIVLYAEGGGEVARGRRKGGALVFGEGSEIHRIELRDGLVRDAGMQLSRGSYFHSPDCR